MQLPHGCRCTDPRIWPDDWSKSASSIKKGDWYINYRFFDSKGNVKQISTRGMNGEKTWSGRVKVTRDLYKNLISRLLAGFNPIEGKDVPVINSHHEISPDTFFIDALRRAHAKLKCSAHTKRIIGLLIGYIDKVASDLNYDALPIEEIRRKHLKIILDELQSRRKLSASNYNHYRAYLLMLFRELVEIDTVETNPVKDIRKQPEIKKLREVLTDEERKRIAEHLSANYPSFWRYLNIFFQSGSRSAELLRLKGKDVDLQHQFFKRTIIKGSQHREVRTVIKNVALPYWQEALSNCGPEQYVFSVDLKPGDSPIHPDQITKRWYRHVVCGEQTSKQKERIGKYGKIKKNGGRLAPGLGIKKSFYSLKHSHADEMARELSLAEASTHAGHTSTRMTLTYAINKSDRQAERIKKLPNKFA